MFARLSKSGVFLLLLTLFTCVLGCEERCWKEGFWSGNLPWGEWSVMWWVSLGKGGNGLVFMKVLRASVMVSSEWYRERDQSQWKRRRREVLQRDQYTCVYCTLRCEKFMQVNHIGAEDNDDLENLETVCAACHSVLHLGISAMEGMLTVFECKPEVKNMAAVVCVTRALVAREVPWDEIEKHVFQRFARSGGRHYDERGSVGFANRMLSSIPRGKFRGYLPQGLAVMFHEAGQWMQYPERVWKWQCLPGSRYRKADQ